MSGLLVAGGRVVSPDADGTVVDRGPTDVLLVDGRVAALGPTGTLRADETLDAAGALVLPGALDLHVHLSAEAPAGPPAPPTGFVDDFASGTAAAAAGGVTTVGQMSFAEDGWQLRAALDRDAAALTDPAVGALVDVLLIPGLVTPTPDDVAEIPRLAAEGFPALKLVDPGFGGDPGLVEAAFASAGVHGMLTLVHCEDAGLVEQACRDLRDAGRGDLRWFADSRPVASEVASVRWACAVSERTGAPLVVVHLSSAEALAVTTAAADRGAPVFVETRPLYLHLDRTAFELHDPGRFTGMPPPRTADDVAALWAGLADGRIDTVATDHAPWRLADKTDPALDVATARMGVADLETQLPMLFSAGVVTGRLTVERLVRLTSTRAAQLYGLFPRKGSLLPGADADLVVLDPDVEWVVDGAQGRSRAGYSPYDGTRVRGAVRATVSRGELVWHDGAVRGRPSRGRQVRRSAAVGGRG